MSCLCITRRQISFIKLGVNCEPKFVNISDGKPTLQNISIRASATRSVSIFGSATASG